MTLKELQSQINKLIEDGHKDKKVLEDNAIDFVVEVASEVATLRLDDKSVYAAILYLIADFEDFDDKEAESVAGKETLDLILNLKKFFRPLLENGGVFSGLMI